MLQKNIRLKDLDEGIRGLVIDLSRIPKIEVHSNCEGHERYAPPYLPVKGGWIWFSRPNKRYKDLAERLQKVASQYDFSSMSTFPNRLIEGYVTHLIGGEFEKFEDESGVNLFAEVWNSSQRANFMRRAKTRKAVMLELWKDLDKSVLSYIREKINPNPKSLAFRGTEKMKGGSCALF